jgi:ankyrin repeat protein
MKRILFILSMFLGLLPVQFVAIQSAGNPVLLFNNRAIYHGGSIEVAELQKHNALTAKNMDNIYQKMNKIAEAIAKRQDTDIVICYSDYRDLLYVNPANDITCEVIDTLNREYLTEQGTEYNLANQKEIKTPLLMLHEAILNDSAEEIRNAIQVGADINLGKDGKAPLWWAILNDKYTAVKTLLEFGASTDESLLQFAMQRTLIRSAILIAQKLGRNLDAITHEGKTLLQLAVSNHDYEAVLLLINAGSHVSGYESIDFSGCLVTLMERIVMCLNGCNEKTCIELIQKLLDRGFKINEMWNLTRSDIRSAVYNNETVLKLIIKNGANPNYVFEQKCCFPSLFWTPLYKAINDNNKQVVEILLNAGANINQMANLSSVYRTLKGISTPLSFAIYHGNKDIIGLLVERGAR